MSYEKTGENMNTELIRRCELLVNNRKSIQSAFKWNSDTMLLAGSSLYVGLDRKVNIEKLKTCEYILKSKAGIFSEYRGNVKMPLLCKMAIASNPERYFEEIDNIVKQMKVLKWIDAGYKVLAAMTMHDHVDMNQVPETINKMVELYQGMKEKHPWLTSGEDIPFVAILAVSEIDTEVLNTEMENCYQELLKYFHDKNAVQSLSHILAINTSDTIAKCHMVEEIFSLLKKNKHKYAGEYELAVLGTLSMLDISAEKIVEDIIEADEYLKNQKGFGNLSLGEGMRRMYAALMVMDTYMPPASCSHESLMDSVLALVIAMEVCMLILMTTVIVTSSN